MNLLDLIDEPVRKAKHAQLRKWAAEQEHRAVVEKADEEAATSDIETPADWLTKHVFKREEQQ